MRSRDKTSLRLVALLAVLALAVAACGGDDDDDTSTTGGDTGTTGADTGTTAAAGEGGETFTIGVSNTLVGNGWREQMVCAIQAQAAAVGVVDEVVLANRNAGTPEQIADIQGLISQGVDAIIVNPTDREALNPVLEEAIAQGIVVVPSTRR